MLSLVSLLISIFALLFSIIHAVYKDDSDDSKQRSEEESIMSGTVIKLLQFMLTLIFILLYMYIGRKIYRVLDDYSDFLEDKGSNGDKNSKVDE